MKVRSQISRSVSTGLCVALVLATLGSFLACRSVSAQCIDYGDYVHWVAGVRTPGYAEGVAVSGDYAYVADSWRGLQVFGITNPENPLVVGGVDTPDIAEGVAVSGNYAYVADRWSGLQVIDVTNPESPVIVGGVDTADDAVGVAGGGNYA